MLGTAISTATINTVRTNSPRTAFPSFRNFKIWETVTFQFRVEAFNALNHGNAGVATNPIPNVTLSNNTLSNPNDPTSFPVQPAFGTITGSGQRVFQFAGKINF
jgi:hypothetical protein